MHLFIGIVPTFSLYKWIHTQKSEIAQSIIYRICYEISLGMHYLHSRTPAIVHRDLKSLNILVCGDIERFFTLSRWTVQCMSR
jgi:serine/threonine protein kinase